MPVSATQSYYANQNLQNYGWQRQQPLTTAPTANSSFAREMSSQSGQYRIAPQSNEMRAQPARSPQLTQAQPQAAESGSKSFGEILFGSDGFDFWDFLDVINPLQHIPVVNSVYRSITGDEIGAAARVAGGALYGGPVGAAIQTADAAMTAITGRDMGEHTMAAFGYGQSQPTGQSAPVMVAQANTAPVASRRYTPPQASAQNNYANQAYQTAQNGFNPASRQAQPQAAQAAELNNLAGQQQFFALDRASGPTMHSISRNKGHDVMPAEGLRKNEPPAPRALPSRDVHTGQLADIRPVKRQQLPVNPLNMDSALRQQRLEAAARAGRATPGMMRNEAAHTLAKIRTHIPSASQQAPAYMQQADTQAATHAAPNVRHTMANGAPARALSYGVNQNSVATQRKQADQQLINAPQSTAWMAAMETGLDKYGEWKTTKSK